MLHVQKLRGHLAGHRNGYCHIRLRSPPTYKHTHTCTLWYSSYEAYFLGNREACDKVPQCEIPDKTCEGIGVGAPAAAASPEDCRDMCKEQEGELLKASLTRQMTRMNFFSLRMQVLYLRRHHLLDDIHVRGRGRGRDYLWAEPL